MNKTFWYLRAVLVGFGLIWSGSCFSAHTWVQYGGCYPYANSPGVVAERNACLASGVNLSCQITVSSSLVVETCSPPNSTFVIAGRCAANEVVNGGQCAPCPTGTSFNNGQCVNDAPVCDYVGAIPHPSGEGCYCPEPQIEGLKNVNGQLELYCIDPFPEEECPEGSHPVTFDDEEFCWTPDPPSECPEGSYSIEVDGAQQCWTPDPDADKCPEGFLYYEINNIGQCVDPQPNIEDPDDPGSSSSSGGSGGSSSSSGSTGGGGSFDDSRIVGRLDQTNNKLDDVNSNLDDIKEGMKGEGVTFDAGVGEGAESFYESEYPGGMSGVWDSRRNQLMQTPPFEFVNQFAITVGSPGQITWEMCANVIIDFGCHDISPPGFVWAFIRLCILITAAFLCRALIFGG